MKKSEAYLIFRFENREDLMQIESHYCVCHLFTAEGMVSFQDLKPVVYDFTEGDELSFDTKDELTEFSYRFIEEHGFSAIYLVNTVDFNIGLEASNDLATFRQVFQKYGLKIELQSDGTKSVLSKFFS